MFKNEDFLISLRNKEGKNRKIKQYSSRICIGNLYYGDNEELDAIQYNEDGKLLFVEENCSKCYLCLLNKNLELDPNNYPALIKKSTKYNFTPQDNELFSDLLKGYSEETGISKWIMILFELYGFKDLYRESSHSVDFLNKKAIEAFIPSPKPPAKPVFKKAVLADIEVNEKDFTLIFENKKWSKDDSWIKKGIGQICLYSTSKIYQSNPFNEPFGEDKYFILAYNGTRDERRRINEVISKEPYSMLKEIMSTENNHFCVLNSSQIYSQLLNDLENNTIKKESLINLVKENVVEL